MNGPTDPARLAQWHAGALPENDLAAALLCDVEDVRVVLAAAGFRTRCGSAEERSPTHVAPRQRAGLAMSLALHRQAGLPLAVAADMVSGAWRVCDSVLATLDFFPDAEGTRASPRRRCHDERDPFMLFAPHASEELPIPAIDEYIDVVEGRRIVWRKPRRSPYKLACELHRLSSATKRDDTPALQEEYLDVLCRLREPADHVAEWIGTLVDGRFRPRPDRFADETPFLRQGLHFAGDPAPFAEAYGTRMSVNVSLAARSMKRRMLGLDVIGPRDGAPTLNDVALEPLNGCR